MRSVSDADVIGLDIDLGHFEENRARLRKRGAFARNAPELFEYDQLVCGEERLETLLNGRRLDIVIDDGLHSLEAIATTWRSVKPFLAPRFVYFIEDYPDLPAACPDVFTDVDVRSYGMMTVVSRGLDVD